MKKLFFLFLISYYSYSQDYTQKWNEYLNRYEFFDKRGNMTGYKKYNSYLQSWEYYNLNSENNYNTVKSSINAELIQNALNSRQESYNRNVRKINDIVDIIKNEFITQSKSSQIYNIMINRFYKEYINNINNNSYDLSNNSQTDKIINYLLDGAILIMKEENK